MPEPAQAALKARVAEMRTLVAKLARLRLDAAHPERLEEAEQLAAYIQERAALIRNLIRGLVGPRE
jgi:hypothetical protein